MDELRTTEEKPEEVLEKEQELSVAKTVLKTGLLTALVFLLVLVFAFTLAAFISPKFVSDLSLKLGARNLSATFAIAQYERTKDINDLATAIERAVAAEKHKEVAEYSKKLVEWEPYKELDELVKKKDKVLNSFYQSKPATKDMVSNYYNYIYGNYVYSLYKINEKIEAYNIAFDNTTDYTDDNPMHRYVRAYIEDTNRTANDELLNELGKRYDKITNDLTDIDEKTKICGLYICADLAELYKTLGNPAEAEKWNNNFENLYKS